VNGLLIGCNNLLNEINCSTVRAEEKNEKFRKLKSHKLQALRLVHTSNGYINERVGSNYL
jgi:hypothetical protein